MAEKMRTITFIDEFVKEDGCFKEFADFVREHEELELLFRGNSSDMAIVYFCNNIVWKLKKTKNEAKVFVNYNHLRYCSNWENIISEKYNKLYGFPLVTRDDITSKYNLGGYKESVVDIKKGEKFDKEYVVGLYEVIKGVMSDYFFPYYNNEKASNDDARLMDHFRDKNGEDQLRKKDGTMRKKPNYLEKRRQQKYFSKNCNLENGIYIYDLEYKEPHKNMEEKKDAMKAKGRKKMNKPDCLGIRFENSKPVSLVMVELKSNVQAESGKSGTEEHLDGMWTDLMDADFVNSRLEEAHAIMESYKKVRMHGFKGEEDIPSFEKIKKREILIVYTDDSANSKTEGKYSVYSEKFKHSIPYEVKSF